MPELNNHGYYAERARIAREQAGQAQDEQIRLIHLDRAQHYDALIESTRDQHARESVGSDTPSVARDASVGDQLPPRDVLALMLTDAMPQMVWSTRPDGFHDYFNPQWYAFTGVPDGSTDGEGWNAMFHPEDRERAWKRWRESIESGEPYEIEYRLQHHRDGYRWTLGRALPMRDSTGKITRWIGTCTDIDEAKKTSQAHALLTREMGHRISNLFSILGSIIAMEARHTHSSTELADTMRSRLQALAAAHRLGTPQDNGGSPGLGMTLHGIIGGVVRPYQSNSGERLHITGADFPASPACVTALALVFHELCTNAVKYGALSVEEGKVDIQISDNGTSVRVAWSETGGPGAAAPTKKSGFGSKLIDANVVRQLGGTVDYAWPETGLQVMLGIPLTAITEH